MGKLAANGAESPDIATKSLPLLADQPEETVKALFAEFMTKFDKRYTDEDEAAMRMEIFRRNLKRIDEVFIHCTRYIVSAGSRYRT